MTDKKRCALIGCDRPVAGKLVTLVPKLGRDTEIEVCQLHLDAAKSQKHKDITIGCSRRGIPWGKVTQ